MFRCPSSVAKRIEYIKSHFLSNDANEKRRYHLVSWKMICKPLWFGRIGIQDIKEVHSGLPGEWLWQIGKENITLWLYGSAFLLINIRCIGWKINEVANSSFGFQKVVSSIGYLFLVVPSITCVVTPVFHFGKIGDWGSLEGNHFVQKTRG